jgi:nicotinamidase-related amidase
MKIDPTSSAIVVVDMQRDFCDASGRLFVPGARRIVPRIKDLISSSRKHNIPIIFTQDWHMPDDPEFDAWGEHCVMDTEGAEVIEELRGEGYLIRKRRYSAFFGADLDLFLRERNTKTLVIAGVVTNICVLHTAADATLQGYNVIVPSDCVAARDDYDQEYAMHHISSVFKGKIISSGEIEWKNQIDPPL